MSLYNMIFGVNPLSDLLLGMVGLTRGDVGRFRDAYLEKSETNPDTLSSRGPNGAWLLHVYTRNGGGNREHYGEEDVESGAGCACTGCVAEYLLPSHPLYLHDQDDDFDCTYATFTFQVPPQFTPFCEELEASVSPEETPGKRWERLLSKLHNQENDSEVKNALAVMAPVLDKIHAALEEKKSDG